MSALHATKVSSGMFRSGAPPALTARSRSVRPSSNRRSLLIANVVKVGDKAPDFSLKDQVSRRSFNALPCADPLDDIPCKRLKSRNKMGNCCSPF